MSRRLSCACAAVGIFSGILLVLSQAGPALADGAAASACHFANNEGVVAFGLKLNTSSLRQSFVCEADPPTKIGSTGVGFRVIGAQITRLVVFDNSTTEDIVCRFSIVDKAGVIQSSGSVSSAGTGTMDIANPAILQVTSATVAARATLVCDVPPPSASGVSGLNNFFAEAVTQPIPINPTIPVALCRAAQSGTQCTCGAGTTLISRSTSLSQCTIGGPNGCTANNTGGGFAECCVCN